MEVTENTEIQEDPPSFPLSPSEPSVVLNLFGSGRTAGLESLLGFVGKLARRPESEQFFRLAKTTKQTILVLSSIQPDAVRRKKGRSKPDRILRQAPR